jgi:hypothetical protein
VGNLNEDSIAIDDSHPIANIHSYDSVVKFEGGGAYLGMVVSSPLDQSPRSLSRFAAKQRFYLESFFSEYGKKEWGTPVECKMKIFIRMHPASSASAFESLESFKREAGRHGVEVRVDVGD